MLNWDEHEKSFITAGQYLVWAAKDAKFLHADNEHFADAQADLRIRWEQMSEVTFSHISAHTMLITLFTVFVAFINNVLLQTITLKVTVRFSIVIFYNVRSQRISY